MEEGLLWYDDNPGRNLTEKIGKAARRYRQKFGAMPNVCYVHPSVLSGNGKVQKVDGMRVASLPSVLRHHFWVGREEKQQRRRAARSGRN
ncbi:MAG: hypothetical protein SXV54_16220 [Chloroflexota bacterium]|nr:hypothetical protein [Chloroflexota bacterium]